MVGQDQQLRRRRAFRSGGSIPASNRPCWLWARTELPVPSQTTVLTIEIDRPGHLARQTTTVQGQQLIMLKQGEQAAMKLGAGEWQLPAGPYETMAKDMGNLFVCEIESPETKENAPIWKVTGTDLLDGQETLVIETEGNLAVPIAQERMSKGLTKVFADTPLKQATVKVLEYSSKHWIRKSDFCHLQAVQTSKAELSIPLADGKTQVIEQSLKATSKYSYEQVNIEIPEDARKILSSTSPASKMGEAATSREGPKAR